MGKLDGIAWRVVVPLLAASACAEPEQDVFGGPCETLSDCRGSEACVESTCVDVYDDIQYRIESAWVVPPTCPEGIQWQYSLFFDDELVAASPFSTGCPPQWGPLDEMVFVPTREHEPFRIRFIPAGSTEPSELEWDGVPQDVLHYGTWQGFINHLDVRFDIVPVGLVGG